MTTTRSPMKGSSIPKAVKVIGKPAKNSAKRDLPCCSSRVKLLLNWMKYLCTMRLSTKLIHAGIEPDPSTGAIMTPIYQTSTYVQSAPGVHKGFEYARSQNPTRFVLESALAHIENGKHGLCFSSGVAATDAVQRLLVPGDEVIAAGDMYGGTYRLFTKVFEKTGIRFHFVNMQDASAIQSYVNANTRLIWAETPTNPLMNIVDIAALAAIGKQHNILLCVDNTFASP